MLYLLNAPDHYPLLHWHFCLNAYNSFRLLRWLLLAGFARPRREFPCKANSLAKRPFAYRHGCL